MNTTVKFGDNSVVMGLISDNNEKAYLENCLENWCQENNLLQLIVDLSTMQERSYLPLMINGTPVETPWHSHHAGPDTVMSGRL